MLCGYQRKLYLEERGTKYWDKVDRSLEVIRTRASGDAVKIAVYVMAPSHHHASFHHY